MSWSDFFNLQVVAGLAGPFIGFVLGRVWQGTATWTWSRALHVMLVIALVGVIAWNGASIVSAKRAEAVSRAKTDRKFHKWQVRLDQQERENRQLTDELVRRTRWLMRAQVGSPHERAVQAAKNFERVVDRIRRRDLATSGRYRGVPFETLTRRIETQYGRSKAKCMKAGIAVVASIPGLPGPPGNLLSPVEFCTNTLTMEEAAPRLMALAEAVR